MRKREGEDVENKIERMKEEVKRTRYRKQERK